MYVGSLYDQGTRKLSFEKKSVTFPMIKQFVIAVLNEASKVCEPRPRHCECCSVKVLKGVYDRLHWALQDVVKNEEAIMQKDVFRCCLESGLEK